MITDIRKRKCSIDVEVLDSFRPSFNTVDPGHPSVQQASTAAEIRAMV